MIAPASIAWLGDTLVATSVMMALVLLIRQPVARAFGARIAYLLWLIPAARFVMPTLTAPTEQAVASDMSITSLSLTGPAVMASASVETAGPSLFEMLWSALPAIWLGGAIVCLSTIGICHVIFRRRLLASAVEAPAHAGFRVIASPVVSVPLAIGILRPLIAVPADFETQFGPAERLHILRHEAEHHRHGDLWANLAAALVLSAHWFNPVAWFSWKMFRLDQEKCCDARVTASADRSERAVYAATLAKAVIGPRVRTVPLIAPMIARTELKERLKMLKQTRAFSRPRMVAGIAGVGMLMATGLVLTATVVPATAASSASAHTQAAVPPPPAPPTPPTPPAAPVPADAPLAPLAPLPPTAPSAPQPSLAPPAPPASHDGDEAGEKQATVIRKKDGKRAVDRRAIRSHEYGAIPTEAEITAMIPEIDIKRIKGKCDAAEPVVSETTTGKAGKQQKIRIQLCDSLEIVRKARASALEGLTEARVEIAIDGDIPTAIKAQVLANLDQQIAKMRVQAN